ncbi:MAG TPA: hypothetical protein VF695_04125 [Sphingomonas sp.]|jgi:hypothetical protein
MRSLAILAGTLMLALPNAACSSARDQEGDHAAAAKSWWDWHDRKRETDMAVEEALGAPGGAD